jgi:hypothetical protein
MDVMHRQVEEYESEIRFLKDAKTPKGRSRTPRRSYAEHIREHSRSGDDLQSLASEGSVGAFEAALFRPALQAARRDAAQWKAKATISTLLELPPLHVTGFAVAEKGEEKVSDEDTNPLLELSSALAFYRTETASVKVVDITQPKEGKSSRSCLHESMMRKASAANQLDQAAAAARQWLERNGAGHGDLSVKNFTGNPLVGRVKFAGPDPIRTVPTATNREDLYRLQLHLVQ